MQNPHFDTHSAREYLKRKEKEHKLILEKKRLDLLEKTIQILRNKLQNKKLEVWVIGSILIPNQFNKNSDVDIVIKNLQEDRFELWSLLEREIEHEIEIILFEECDFKDMILKKGYKVL